MKENKKKIRFWNAEFYQDWRNWIYVVPLGLYILPLYGYFIKCDMQVGLGDVLMKEGCGWEIMEEWKMYRNFAYMFYIVLIIGVGVGRMAGIWVEDQLKKNKLIGKIVKSLLLATFSYAIAALTIDLYWIAKFAIQAVSK